MNKAFVRESDSTLENCPRCGSAGLSVAEATLDAWVPSALRQRIGHTAMFCPAPRCSVVYFDALEQVILVGQLDRPIYPKDPAAPICPCFGVGCDVIELDLAEGGVARTREAVARAKSNEADCLRKSPSGRSCVADLQKYYMKGRAATE